VFASATATKTTLC